MFKEHWMRDGGIALALGVSLLTGGLPAVAQDASPGAGVCEAPPLVAGAPVESEASPAALGEDAAAASDEVAAAATTGLDNIVSCIGAGDWEALAALMTPNMVAFLTGDTDPANVPAAMAEVAPMELVHTGEIIVDSAGRVGVPIVFGGFLNQPGTQVAETWYLVEDGGSWKIDGLQATTIPDDLYPDATVLEIQMVDFAFALSENAIPAGPVILRFSNTSFTHQGHVGVTLTLTEGNTSESIIMSDELPEDQVTGFFHAIYLEPGLTGDIYIEDLTPGLYTLVCDVSTPDGTPHWMLGMVSQFTVE
ncbi:MAG TPA: hypothetical protein VFP05_12675 [Thermomicrobiales bacterium]|nr:hypothetical protein [Thermomicrobiales bacterium]